MRARTLAAVMVVLIVSPGRAHANAQQVALGGAAVGYGLWAVVTGLGTGVSLGLHRKVDRRWAVQSMVAWGLLHLAVLGGSAYLLAQGNVTSVKAWAAGIGAAIMTGGMLTLSFYALTVPTDEPEPPTVSLVPCVAPSFAGAVFAMRF